jgi:outer membrane protein assembly factor BamB
VAAALVGAAPAGAANWAQFGATAGHTGFGADTAISLANVGTLSESCRGAITSNTSTSPAIVSRRVYANTGDGRIVAMDAVTCATVWSREIGYSAFSSPAVADGIVYVGISDGASPPGGTLFALDAATGDVRWSADMPGGVTGTPSVAGGRVAVGTGTGSLYLLDAATGAVVWSRSSATTMSALTTTAIAGGVVYFSGSATVRAFQASSGKQLWTRALRGWGFPPVVADGRVYMTSGGSLHALDAVTGNLLWSRSVPGDMLRPPAAAYGRLYTSDTSHAYALEAGTGQTLWTADLPGVSTGFSGTSSAGPVVANRVVYLPSAIDSTLYALNATTGTLVWTGSLGGQAWRSIAVANGSLYANVAYAGAGMRRLSLP